MKDEEGLRKLAKELQTRLETSSKAPSVVVDKLLTEAEKASEATTQLAKRMRMMTTEKLPKCPPKGKLEAPLQQQGDSGQFVDDDNKVTTSTTSSS